MTLSDETRTELRAKAEKALGDGACPWYAHTNGRLFQLEPNDIPFIAEASPSTVLALLDENDQLRRACHTLGQKVDRFGWEIINAADAHHLVNEGGDGDWERVSELLAELGPARDAALARAEKAEAEIDRLRAEVREVREAGVDILAASHQWQDRTEKAEAALDRVRKSIEGLDEYADGGFFVRRIRAALDGEA